MTGDGLGDGTGLGAAVELTPEHPVSTVVDHATAAEREGFDAVFASHHYDNRDQFAALTAAAGATDRVRLGPGIANPYETHPVTLASRMATLDEFSDGRGVFGVGAGDRSTLQALGVDRDRPLRRVLETFRVAKRLWRGETVDHDGTFQAADAALNYAVGDVPVYVGAQGPGMLRMAAKHADGVLFNGAHPRDYVWASDQIEAGLADRPADRGEFDFAAYASVSVAEDDHAAREAARLPVAFIAGGAAEPVLQRHSIDVEQAQAVGNAVAAGEFGAAGDRVTDAMLDAFCIAGAPAQVSDRVDEVLSHADSFVAASPLGPDVERAIPLAARALGTSTG
jgi:5,10-methylenetetrahydromethanopterin reductase